MSVKNSKWARRIKRCVSDDVYKEAIGLASDKSLTFTIHFSTETGAPLWAISIDGFWMDGYKCLVDAEKLCKDMDWKYTIIR